MLKQNSRQSFFFYIWVERGRFTTSQRFLLLLVLETEQAVGRHFPLLCPKWSQLFLKHTVCPHWEISHWPLSWWQLENISCLLLITLVTWFRINFPNREPDRNKNLTEDLTLALPNTIQMFWLRFTLLVLWKWGKKSRGIEVLFLEEMLLLILTAGCLPKGLDI